MGRWKKLLFVCLSVFFLFAGGCKGEERYAGTPVQEVCTVYDGKNVLSYTLDEEGNLYAFEADFDAVPQELKLKKYDKNGELVFSRPFDAGKYTNLSAMVVKNQVLYFTSDVMDKNEICIAVNSYHLVTEELSRIQAFSYFRYAKRILVSENRIYVLGYKKGGFRTNSNTYTYNGEKVMWCPVEGGKEVYEMGLAEPIDMSLGSDGAPVFYVHTEEGFCLMRYEEEQDSAHLLAKTEKYKMNSLVVGDADESILYYSLRGLVMSEISNPDTESELYPDVMTDENLCYVNGRVACRTYASDIVQFLVADVKKEMETLHILSVGYEMETPYGCGYEIERTEFAETELDKFALKILALDRDFDMYLVDSADSVSHNLKKNGVFYPLNDVQGIDEYLDACFPYVREAATDENGTIWMLPVKVDIPGFVVRGGTEEAGKLGIGSESTFIEFFSMLSGLSEEKLEQIGTPQLALFRDFLRQYFASYNSVDTKLFREIMTAIADQWNRLEEKTHQGNVVCEYVSSEEGYHFAYLTETEEDLQAYASPKLSKETKNAGTCLFLVVNPQSEQLETTLRYLTDWIAYTMNCPEKPLFFANRMVEEETYEASLYELYLNGEIVFTIEADIYEGYHEVFSDISRLEKYIAETERKLKMYLNE